MACTSWSRNGRPSRRVARTDIKRKDQEDVDGGGAVKRIRRMLGGLARRLGMRKAPVTTPRAVVTSTTPKPTITWQHPPNGGDPELRVGVFRDLLALFPPGRVLDLGCGTGLFSVAAMEMGWKATAVDARSERMLMTPGIDWVQHDVRTYDVTGFDVIALIGLLYHLELPDQLDLLRRCSGTVTILDTHHSNRPTMTESGYAGHTFHELPEEKADQLAATPTAAWGNLTAFWATQPDLARMLHDAGFVRVLALIPWNLPDRTFYLCLPKREGGAPTAAAMPSGEEQRAS
jgi:SAM-dependent methyltransferase